jgi:hypothetical protein
VHQDRWILFGEPGSGKSTVFQQAAAAAGVETVTARAFAEGTRPSGSVVFIDALEEYRISQPGRDRLIGVVEAIKTASYRQWRIACRAVSLPPADLKYMARELGSFDTWHLDFLELAEQEAILRSIGETEPDAFIRKMTNMAAASLLGNPSTLKLFHNTIGKAEAPIYSRSALFAKATNQMAREVDDTLPDRPGRPTEGAIIEAAEKACLVLILSMKNEIWIDRDQPGGDLFVTKDDLLPSEIDTEALRYALDTQMFRGAGGGCMPAHRNLAEYLAGRALAKATCGANGRPALPLERAIALLSGENGKPAPALLGTFAWFVAELSRGVHHARALELVTQTPEAILFHGDAAMLPPEHRRELLEATGRNDPWFLAGLGGATAIGGLAGDDLQPQFEAILDNLSETPARRAMVLNALAVGRPMPSMTAAVQRFVANTANPDWLRRDALDTIRAIAEDSKAALRASFDALASDTDEGSVLVRIKALAMLVGVDATADEVRKAFVDYADCGGAVLHRADSLENALEATPVGGLFDEPIRVAHDPSRLSNFELHNLIQRALAAAIRKTPALSATDLLRWLGNTTPGRYLETKQAVRRALIEWLGVDPAREDTLFWALHNRSQNKAGQSVHEYFQITGRRPSRSVGENALNDLAAIPAGQSDKIAVELAYRLIGDGNTPDLYWRLWDLLKNRVGAEDIFKRLVQCEFEQWRVEHRDNEVRNAAQIAERLAKDRAWLEANAADVRSGAAFECLAFAAEMYAGHYSHLTNGEGFERVAAWAGEDYAEVIVSGWTALMADYPGSIENLARLENQSVSDRWCYIAAVWVDFQLWSGAENLSVSVRVAFAALGGRSVFTDAAARSKIDSAMVKVIVIDPSGTKALTYFWSLSATKDLPLPYAHLFDNEIVAGKAAEELLLSEPQHKPRALCSALVIVAKTLPRDRLKTLIDKALAVRLDNDARVIWTFAAFMLEPDGQQGAFKSALNDPASHALFDQFNNSDLLGALVPLTNAAVTRDVSIIEHIGTHYRPVGIGEPGFNMSWAVEVAIKAIAALPTAEASEALAALVADPALTAWQDSLRHFQASQLKLRQQAEFRPPKAIEVARALQAGPPATPADLRAVVREILRELADDIRNGDTSGWRGFWNNPGEAGRTPKIENDCRDLLTDRLRDRLIRFGVSAKHTRPEARSMDDGRIDLLIIGEGAAALPLEAKRHTNNEIWTAPNVQLEPYSRSAGSSGHGIYLIFWFGTDAGIVPKTPKGMPRITTPDALREAVLGVLTDEQKTKLDVIVLDVSPPPPKGGKAVGVSGVVATKTTVAKRTKSKKAAP